MRFLPRAPRPLLPLLLLAAGLSGCVATTTDIDRLGDSLKTVQKGQADLIVKMEELDRTLVSLQEKLDESQKKMGSLSQKLDDTQSRLGGRMESISQLLSAATTQASVPVPGELYRTAEGDYRAGRIDLAASGFKTFLERYPESDLADDAQFYLADCYLTRKDYAEAFRGFNRVLEMSLEYRRPALLKRALALAGLGKTADMKATLEQLLKEFPDSNEAENGRRLLRDLESADKKSAVKEKKPEKKEKKP